MKRIRRVKDETTKPVSKKVKRDLKLEEKNLKREEKRVAKMKDKVKETKNTIMVKEKVKPRKPNAKGVAIATVTTGAVVTGVVMTHKAIKNKK